MIMFFSFLSKNGRNLFHVIWNLLTNPEWYDTFVLLVLVGEFILGLLIIAVIPYTEIDWIAYMQEVAGVLEEGDLNYSHLRGDTGPLVYPAGFVYLYSVLYYATDKGTNILRAQYLFHGFYLIFIFVLSRIYGAVQQDLLNNVVRRSSTANKGGWFITYWEDITLPNWVFLLVCLSRRIHSIFMLRCFNDGLAMLLLYAAVWALLHQRWTWGSVFFSLGVSIKMNVLLFAPAWGIYMLKNLGFGKTVKQLSICVLIQAGLGAPFLLTFPAEYMHGAFEFGRKFFYKWTVNLKFLSEEDFLIMQGPQLLIVHLLVLMVFMWWTQGSGGWWRVLTDSFKKSEQKRQVTAPRELVGALFACNFIGVMFARSLHFQFYVWYYHAVPLLLWLTPYHIIIRMILVILLELVWNVYPATAETSLLLWGIHIALLLGLCRGPLITGSRSKRKNA